MKNEQLVKKVVAQLGGQQRLADELGVTQQAVSYWCCKLGYFPIEHVGAIEKLLHEIGSETNRFDMRPDIFGQNGVGLAQSA